MKGQRLFVRPLEAGDRDSIAAPHARTAQPLPDGRSANAAAGRAGPSAPPSHPLARARIIAMFPRK